MSVEQTRSVMERFWAGESGHDPAVLTEDAVLVNVSSGQRWHGRGAITARFHELDHSVFDVEFVPEHVHIADGSAAVEARYVGRHIGDYDGVPASGRDIDVPLVVCYRVEGDEITEIRAWLMQSIFLAQVEG